MQFTIVPHAEGDGFGFDVGANGRSQSYFVPTATQQDFSAFFRDLAHDFGTRVPHIFSRTSDYPAASFPWRPLLTENVHPSILVGYGDPAVLRTDEGWWLVATSNDAPDAFPILHSTDLKQWEPKGFIFPAGQQPAWAASGRTTGDFWAPEMANVGNEYWTVFTARQKTNALAMGLARASSPLGPWTDNGAPLVTGKPVNTTGLGFNPGQPLMRGGVIDSHLFHDPSGDRYLFWKDDTNGIWPRPLAMLLRQHPSLVEELFTKEADRLTARFAASRR